MALENFSLDELKRRFLESSILGGVGEQVRVVNTDAAPIPVAVSNFPAPDELGLTDAELRASAVPVADAAVFARQGEQNITLGSIDERGAGTNFILGNRLPRNAEQFAAGRYRNAGGKIMVAAGGTGVFCLSNPANSDHSVTLTQFMLTATADSDVNFRLDATVNSPTALPAWQPNRAVANTLVGTAWSGITGVTGGSAISPVFRLGANQPDRQDFVTTLLPGQNLCALLTNPALSSTGFYVTASWIEEPL